MSVMDTLVTDRIVGATYDINDVNRVWRAMEYVAQRLRDCGQDVEITPKYVTRANQPTLSMMSYYLDQLAILRDAYQLALTVPPVPPVSASRPYLMVQEANDIERILLAVYDMICNVQGTIELGWALGTSYTGLYTAAPSLRLMTESGDLLVDARDRQPDLLHLPDAGAGQLIIEYAGQNYLCEVT